MPFGCHLMLSAAEVELVGHSLGGLVACQVAASGQARVSRLVLEDTGMPHPRPPQTPARPAGPLSFDWAMVEQIRPEIDEPEIVTTVHRLLDEVRGAPRGAAPDDGSAPDGELVGVRTGWL